MVTVRFEPIALSHSTPKTRNPRRMDVDSIEEGEVISCPWQRE